MGVIWITGLPGAGKTSAARALVDLFRAGGEGVLLLDGDALRGAFATLREGYDRESRLALAQAYARLAALLSAQGFTVVVATVSLFHAIHERNRASIGRYLEVLLECEPDERRRRRPDCDLGGDRAGFEVAAERPLAPDLVIDSAHEDAGAIARRIFARWQQ